MTIKKLKLLVFSVVISALIQGTSCWFKTDKKEKKNNTYSKVDITRGKRLFLDNCAVCHIPSKKDSLFFTFLYESDEDTLSAKLVLNLDKILTNNIHENIISNVKFSHQELNSIIGFIKSPLNKGDVQ